MGEGITDMGGVADEGRAQYEAWKEAQAYGREHPFAGVCGEDDALADRIADYEAERLAEAREFGRSAAARLWRPRGATSV